MNLKIILIIVFGTVFIIHWNNRAGLV